MIFNLNPQTCTLRGAGKDCPMLDWSIQSLEEDGKANFHYVCFWFKESVNDGKRSESKRRRPICKQKFGSILTVGPVPK